MDMNATLSTWRCQAWVWKTGRDRRKTVKQDGQESGGELCRKFPILIVLKICKQYLQTASPVDSTADFRHPDPLGCSPPPQMNISD